MQTALTFSVLSNLAVHFADVFIHTMMHKGCTTDLCVCVVSAQGREQLTAHYSSMGQGG